MRLSYSKYFLLLIAVLFYLQPVGAQIPQNRTTATIVADALAVLPAQSGKEYNQSMTALVNTGEEGLLAILNMFDASGKNNNEKPEFAISGWTNFVSSNESLRKAAAVAYGNALALPLDKTTKQLIMRQLELIGYESNIGQLAVFLTDEYLSGPAAKALASIDSPKAVDALLNALSESKTENQTIIFVNALGQTGSAVIEPVLLDLIKNASPELLTVLHTAISKTGTVASVPVLKQSAQQSAFNNKNNATAAYIDLLNRLAHTQQAVVRTEAEELLKAATKLNLQHLRISAVELLLSMEAVNKISILSYALKDKDDKFIANFMNLYTNYSDPKATNLIVKKLKSTKSENTKATMIYWLGNAKVSSAVSQISKCLNSTNPLLQKAAILSLLNIGGEQTLNALVGLLSSSNKVALNNVHTALESYGGNISNVLIASYPDFSEEGKQVALDLIGQRKMNDQYAFVYNEMLNGTDKVRLKAAQTLKNVVTPACLPQLFDQLEKEDSKFRDDIQNSVNKALSEMPVQQQLYTIIDRMKKTQKPHVFFNSLANTGSGQALEMILSGYNGQGISSEAAFAALLSVKTFDAVYPLLDIARTSKKNQEIGKAVDALILLISSSDKTGIVKANYLQQLMSLAQTNEQKIKILNQLGTTNCFQALLFIEQFLEINEMAEPAAQAGMKIALSSTEFAGSVTNRILTKISAVLSNPDATYQRKAIDKYLSENKDIEGFVSIFNGKDLSGWKGLVGNPVSRAKMKPQELALAQKKADAEATQTWLVENGELVFSGKGSNLCTGKLYGDFEMLIDWKLLPGDEPDAGIYLRGTPQVQIWDTARVNVGAQVGSGGLYNNQINPSKPLKVADQKVGEWNTFHIKMIGDRVTVHLNGELVTNNVILENYWDRNLPVFANEQIELQAHGSKVIYRNIYIKEIPRSEPFKLSIQEEKDGFEVLFDGTNMHKWTGNTTDYITENGVMVIYPSKSHGGNLYTREEFSDFIFRFHFQLTSGANNGLGIRTPMEGDAAYVGMELQILDNEAPIYANLEPYQYHGSVYGIIPSVRGFLKPIGEWNYQEVIAKGDYIKVTLNGTIILEGNIREATKDNGPVDKKNHPGLFNKKGHIGFLGHGSVVRFKDIRIKKL